MSLPSFSKTAPSHSSHISDPADPSHPSQQVIDAVFGRRADPTTEWSGPESGKYTARLTSGLTCGAVPVQQKSGRWSVDLPSTTTIPGIFPPEEPTDLSRESRRAAVEFIERWSDAVMEAREMGGTASFMQGLVKPSLDDGEEAMKQYTADYLAGASKFSEQQVQEVLSKFDKRDMFNTKVVSQEEYTEAGGELVSLSGRTTDRQVDYENELSHAVHSYNVWKADEKAGRNGTLGPKFYISSMMSHGCSVTKASPEDVYYDLTEPAYVLVVNSLDPMGEGDDLSGESAIVDDGEEDRMDIGNRKVREGFAKLRQSENLPSLTKAGLSIYSKPQDIVAYAHDYQNAMRDATRELAGTLNKDLEELGTGVEYVQPATHKSMFRDDHHDRPYLYDEVHWGQYQPWLTQQLYSAHYDERRHEEYEREREGERGRGSGDRERLDIDVNQYRAPSSRAPSSGGESAASGH
ncbi:hypothetical protein IAT38_008394 [Cryptococcus sp. DSM 104549]